MRIALCGAGGTGKSTFAKVLAAELGLELPPSQSRAVLLELGYSERDLDDLLARERYVIQKTMLERKMELDHKHPDAVFDRTVIDHFFYLQLRALDPWVLDDSTYRTIHENVMAHMSIYDVILYCPYYGWQIPSDGLRKEGQCYRTFADYTMYAMLCKCPKRFWRVPNVLPQERLAWFKKKVLPKMEEEATRSPSQASASVSP